MLRGKRRQCKGNAGAPGISSGAGDEASFAPPAVMTLEEDLMVRKTVKMMMAGAARSLS